MSDLPTAFSSPVASDVPVTDDHAPNPATGFWGYLLEEDYGLKMLLSGITVSDLQSSNRGVKVWFDNPQKEERSTHFPFITVAFAGESIDSEREHRGYVQVDYKYLQNATYAHGAPVLMDYPIPMMLDYIVTTHARNNQHHSQLNAALSMILHPRFGVVTCPGGTTRRLVLRSKSPTSGIDSTNQRVFRTTYRVRIPTEIESRVATGTRVKEVVLTVRDTVSGLRETTTTAPVAEWDGTVWDRPIWQP